MLFLSLESLWLLVEVNVPKLLLLEQILLYSLRDYRIYDVLESIYIQIYHACVATFNWENIHSFDVNLGFFQIHAFCYLLPFGNVLKRFNSEHKNRSMKRFPVDENVQVSLLNLRFNETLKTISDLLV